MKKLLALTLALLMVLSLCACGKEVKKDKKDDTTTTTSAQTTESQAVTETQTQGEPSVITPLLYKVTDNDGDAIWLFGSIHIGEEYMYPLPDYVYNAFDSSDYLAVECDVVAAEEDLEATQALLMKLIYLDGTTIKDHVSEEVYEGGVEILTEMGIYNSFLDYYMPSMWSTLFDQTSIEYFGFDMLLGVDRHLMARAEEKGIDLVEIESMDAQYQMMANYSEKLQELLLEGSIESYKDEEVKENMNELLKSWCKGDETELVKILAEEDDAIEPDEMEYYEEYQKAMMTDRNLLMTDFAEDALKNSEEAFITVGEAHIIGEGGIADQLAKRGYTVEIVK